MNLKTGVSRKQSTPNFPKNKHFLPPDTYTYKCVSGGKKCSFFEKFGVLSFSWNTSFEIRPITLLPTIFLKLIVQRSSEIKMLYKNFRKKIFRKESAAFDQCWLTASSSFQFLRALRSLIFLWFYGRCFFPGLR